jgi:5-(carboxyamino)imidazole ribonucleotide synthase
MMTSKSRKSIGIIGGGQLARMLTLAGVPLGLRLRVFDPSNEACAGQIAALTCGAFGDATALLAFARDLDVLTFDFENVPGSTLQALAVDVQIAPNPQALVVSQDRLLEKQTFSALGIPVGPYVAVETRAQMDQAIARLGAPGILKTRTLGYDGKGQMRVHQFEQAQSAFESLALAPCIYEQMIRFERELSIIAVRAANGDFRCYPLTENIHDEGILALSIAPADCDSALQNTAQAYARKVAEHFQYVGTFALEFFQVGQNLLLNEMAPRVHNSGHWTIEGSSCSQFENHLRAIAGLPLGATNANGVSIMLNWVSELPDAAAHLQAFPNSAEVHSAWHDYGKSAREGRKLGHCTLNGPSLASLREHLEALQVVAPSRPVELALAWFKR